MPDFAMDYDQLYAMQRGLHLLADRADSGGGDGVYEEVGNASASENEAVFGSYDLAYAFTLFYRKSKTIIDDGKDKLRRFGDMFSGVADGLFQQDAQLAAGASASAGQAMIDRWEGEREAYEQWSQNKEAWDSFLQEIGAAEYFAEHPDADIAEVCASDDAPAWCAEWENAEDPPQPPGDEPPKPPEHPPSHLQFSDGEGGTTDIVLSYDEDYNIMKEETTVTTQDGETLTTTVEYEGEPNIVEGDDGKSFDTRDYTVTTTLPDGSTVEENVVIEDDGSGTRSVTSTYTEDGEEKTETTEYTRSGPFECWDESGNSDADDGCPA